MSYNGSGTFLINTAGQPVVSGTVISSTAFNALTADLATGLSTAITKDGQTTVTANIPMSTYKFTGLGVGSAATDSANLSQVQSTVTKLLNSVSGADTITATASPTLSAYAAGQMFYFVAAGDNTTSVTLNIDSLGAKAVTRDGATALAAADIKSGEVVVVVYDGTRFQVVSQLNSAGDARFANVSIASSLYVGGVSTFVGNAGFSANVSIASALSVGGVAAITGATTIGGNLTLSGGTANGVLYLNGSKVATSGSALYFNGTQFGVGTNSINAANTAEVTGDIANTWSVGATRFVGSRFSDGAGYELGIKTVMDTRETRLFAKAADTGGFVTIATGTTPSERLRVDASGNVGIGTASPTTRLDVNGSGTIRGELAAILPSVVGSITARNSSTTAAELHIRPNSGKSGWLSFTEDSVADRWVLGTAAGNGSLIFGTGNPSGYTERMRLDSSGNLGLGVTPSAWETANSVRAFQLNGGNVSSFSNAYIWVGQNWYRDSASAERYVNTAAATKYQQAFGAHSWFTAASGTAGNTISFTQAMTLDSSGNLGIGTTSPATKLSITNDSAATNSAVDVLTLTQTSSGTAASGLGPGVKFMSERPDGIVLNRAGIYGVAGSAADDDGDMTFWTLTTTAPGGFTEKMRLDSSGNLGLGVTPSAWFSGYTALQIPAGSFSGFQTATLIIQQNSFFSAATSDNRYVNNGFAGQYTMVSGQHRWLTAPSGTAGAAISFTQAMTLDASGNLGIGTASPAVKLEVNGQIRTAAPTGGTAANWRLGTVHTVSPTSPNRTIEVDIGGTIYYLHAKTTNN